ncbi:MAG TPA: serine/threonine-protein kinase, partial [Alphaproteobacteria bacterium]|nr:serine/threonine-protein kinase [Alphaproteobacteria bacterium]
MATPQHIPSAPGGQSGPGAPPPDQTTVMFVRFDLHKGSRDSTPALSWEPEGPIARLVKKIVRRNEGKIAEEHENVVTAHFPSTLPAISAAETLQRKLQNVSKNPAGKKTAAAVTISRLLRAVQGGTCHEDSPTAVIVCRDQLQNAKPGQILMTEEVFNAAKDAPGVASRAVAAGNAGENGAGKMYELVWAQDHNDSQALPRTDELNVTFSSRYEILAELGRGAMGVVYKAKDRVIGRTVALKTIAVGHDSPDHAEIIERLKLEAKAAGSLDHPNIVTIYDVGNDGDRVYLSMQFVEGATLGKLLSVGKVGSLPTLLSYAEQMCSAVAFAHDRGVIHRDLKPSNIMLTSRGQVKVLDFGIAKLGDAALTQSGMVIGTPAYMAPEQATGKEVDQRSDIFSLGAVFYEMFTGKKPFGADTITAALYKVVHEDPEPPIGANPSLPNGLDILIRRALNKNPKHRFQSCAQMLNALRHESARLKTAPAQGSSQLRARVIGYQDHPRPRSFIRSA